MLEEPRIWTTLLIERTEWWHHDRRSALNRNRKGSFASGLLMTT